MGPTNHRLGRQVRPVTSTLNRVFTNGLLEGSPIDLVGARTRIRGRIEIRWISLRAISAGPPCLDGCDRTDLNKAGFMFTENLYIVAVDIETLCNAVPLTSTLR